MSEHMEKIGQIIKDLSTETTFSADAMRQFMELKDEVEKQESQIKFLRQRNNDKDEELKQIEAARERMLANLEEAQEALAKWQAKDEELRGRETQIAVLEARVNHAEQRVEDHQNMVGLVFRNAEFKRSVLGQELHYQPGNPEMRDQYGNIQTYHQEPGLVPTDVKKDETETQT